MSTVPAHLVLHLDIPVAWGEQDGFGHLNNTFYFRYCENVRMHYLQRIGVLAMHEAEGKGVVLASATCQFRRPVHWPQTLRVYTGCTHLGHTSFVLEYLITNESGEVVADGSSVLVAYDYHAASKMPVPDPVREAIARLQAA